MAFRLPLKEPPATPRVMSTVEEGEFISLHFGKTEDADDFQAIAIAEKDLAAELHNGGWFTEWGSGVRGLQAAASRIGQLIKASLDQGVNRIEEGGKGFARGLEDGVKRTAATLGVCGVPRSASAGGGGGGGEVKDGKDSHEAAMKDAEDAMRTLEKAMGSVKVALGEEEGDGEVVKEEVEGNAREMLRVAEEAERIKSDVGAGEKVQGDAGSKEGEEAGKKMAAEQVDDDVENARVMQEEVEAREEVAVKGDDDEARAKFEAQVEEERRRACEERDAAQRRQEEIDRAEIEMMRAEEEEEARIEAETAAALAAAEATMAGEEVSAPVAESTYTSGLAPRVQGGAERVFVSTAIAYTNGPPHIGHAYEAITADAVSRWHAAMGRDVFFLTGTDEHGTKIANAAESQGTTPIDLCDRYVGAYKRLYASVNISYNEFVRTSSEQHRAVAQEVFMRADRAGDIYLGEYSGWYSDREEAFVSDNDAAMCNHTDAVSGAPLRRVSEQTYFFRWTFSSTFFLAKERRNVCFHAFWIMYAGLIFFLDVYGLILNSPLFPPKAVQVPRQDRQAPRRVFSRG